MKAKLLTLILCSCIILPLSAQNIVPEPPKVTASSWAIMDAQSGKFIAEYNADLQLPPASLTKMMVAYIVSSDISAGKIALEDKTTVSVNAWRKGGARSGGSTTFLLPNTQVSVKDLLYGTIVQSGNDATIVLAEHIAGSEEEFTRLMNQVAAREGLHSTEFLNATGLPIEGHVSTARDLSVLARMMIRDYPEQYKIYQEKYFKHNDIVQRNRNKLLWLDSSVDGLKTGYTRQADYCQTVSAKRGNTRFIITTLASETTKSRIKDAQKLFAWAFRNYRTYILQSHEKPVQKARVWYSDKEQVEIYVANDILMTAVIGDQEDVKLIVNLTDRIKAPMLAGAKVGTLTATHRDQEVAQVDLIIKEDIEEAPWWQRLRDVLALFFSWLFSV